MRSLKLSMLLIGLLAVVSAMQAWATETLDFGQTQTGAITAPAQTVRYTFSANKSDVIDFTVVATSSGLSPKIELYTAGGTLVSSAANYNCCGGCAGGAVIEMNGTQLPATGTYTVIVTDCSSTNTGNFILYLQRTNAPSGGLNFPFARTLTGKIGSAAQSNTYTFSGNKNDYVTLTVVTDGGFSPKLRLYNPAGSLNDTAVNLNCCGGCAGGATVEMNGAQLPASGSFTLLLGDCGDTDTGSYMIYLQRTNNPATPTDLVWDQSQTGAVASPAESNTFTFEAGASDTADFTVTATSGSMSPKLRIYNPNGTLLKSAANLNCCGGCAGGATLVVSQVTLPTSGTYTALIGDCGDTSLGGYNISTQCFGACPLPAPTLSSIAPNSALVGSPGIALSVNGTNFANVESTSVVEWGGTALAGPGFVNTAKLTAPVPATNFGAAGVFPVTVVTPGPGGGTSNAVNFIVKNPVPTLTSIAPANAIAGGAAFTLTLTGTSFVKGATGSLVYWSGISVPTTWVSATELQAVIPATDIATASASVPVTVVNPHSGSTTVGGGTTAAQPFVVDNPVPMTKSISPASATASSAGFTLTVNGSNFVATSQVNWNGGGLPTTFVSAGELQAAVSAADIRNAGTAQVTVTNPAPGGGASTPALTFTINPTLPTTTSITPSSAIAGGAAFTLLVKGTNFLSGAKGSYANWNGKACNLTPCVTTYVSPTQLKVSIPATFIATAGTLPVTVTNPVAGGGTSSAQTFTVDNPVPVAASLLPTSGPLGGPEFTLTVNGSSFVVASRVSWNGTMLTPVTVTPTAITVLIPASGLSVAGNVAVEVVNPAPGGGTSAALTFAVKNPVPVLSSISPTSLIAGGNGFTLTATGTSFVQGAQVRRNGYALATTFVSATEVQAAVPAGDTLDGTAKITIWNPGPGGGTSAAQTLTIDNPVPVAMSLSPSSIAAGSAGFTLTVTGFNFNEGAVIQWNGAALATAFVSDTELQAAIPSTAIAAKGSASVTVANPAPSASASNVATFTIN